MGLTVLEHSAWNVSNPKLQQAMHCVYKRRRGCVVKRIRDMQHIEHEDYAAGCH
eukprot:COSAG02_NODE_8005_length_2749_cov_1.949811_1_plen_54_part_00